MNSMISYRITKYNPALRDSDGIYLDNMEWTSISDIGKPKYNSPTYEEYETVETAYVQAILLILNKGNIKSLKVDSLEQYCEEKDFINYQQDGTFNNISIEFKDIRSLEESKELFSANLEKYVRLILREVIWMDLIADNFELRIGYDYYMYIKCLEITPESIIMIQKLGLFVEPGIEPVKFETISED